jgi:cysteine dioxygenase
LTGLLRRVLVTPAALAPYLLFNHAGYRRNPVAEGRHFEVKVLCWRAGQCSPIHDHAGSACGVRVLRGVAAETVYDVSDPARPRPVRTGRLAAGAVTASFDRDAHRLAAAGGDLVTLHVYAPRLHAMTLYPDAPMELTAVAV